MNWDRYLAKSYVPYSENPMAAFVKAGKETFYPGVRIENVSFPLTITALQGAVLSALADGAKPATYYLSAPLSEAKTGFWENEYELKRGSVSDIDDSKIYSPFIDTNVDLKDKLIHLTEHALCAYSDFPVSALLETEKGLVPGVNIECSEWNLGLCAERVAVSRAISAGCKSFKSIHVFAPKSEFISPCGACRQVLSEWMSLEKVYLYHGNDSKTTHVLKHLLPFEFTTLPNK